MALLGSARAGASDSVYAIGYATKTIYRVDLANGTTTAVYPNYPIAPATSPAAAFAQRSSDGMLFYIAGTRSNGAVYRWNPATPAVAPVFLGTTGAATGYLPRLAFGSDETLYAMSGTGTQLYTISTTTGAATPAVAPLSGTPRGGGDMAFNPANGLLYLAAGRTLYTVPLGGGALTRLGNIRGMTGIAVGIAFAPVSGALLVANSAKPARLYSVNLSTLVATPLRGTVRMGDLASVPRRETNLRITKSDGVTTLVPGTPVTYTVTVTNAGPLDASSATVTDSIPASILTPTWTCTSEGGATCPVASGSGSITESIASFPAGSSLTYTITGTVSSAATGTLVNTASVAAPGVPDSEPSDNTATDVDALIPDAVLPPGGETTVSSLPIDAVDDSGAVASGVIGGEALEDVRANDTLGGAPVSLITVSLRQISTTNPGLTLDPVTGAVNVVAGTPGGSYTLVYEICELLNPANCDQAQVVVTVAAAGNQPPLAQDDAAATAALTPVVVDVLANDSDPDGDTLTISAFGQPGNGLVACPALTCTYTPSAGFSGSDSFTYTITDGNGGSDTATATVTVG